jgi:histidinol-phosphate aminotransferase
MVDQLGRRQLLLAAAVSLAYVVAWPRRAQAGPPSEPGAPINVSLNESPFGPSPRALSALRNDLHALERYTTSEQVSALSRQIAELERVPEDQVLLGEILEPLGSSLSQSGGPGGEFLFSEPGYTALVDAARPLGGVGVPIPLDAHLQNDLPTFRAKLNPRSRAVFLVNPHNPSGTVSDANAFKAAVSELAKHTLVIVDEAYLEYVEGFDERTCAALVRAGENVIVFRTFSKIHGLAALPLGYALAPRALAASLRARGIGSPRSLNRLSLVAARASLRDPGHSERVRRLVATERAEWHRVLDALQLRHSQASASFVYFQGPPQSELALALAEAGIQIGRSFAPFNDWTRISIGLPSENRRVQSALRKLVAVSGREVRAPGRAVEVAR